MKKVALVTGANKGIGLEICWQLAQKGFHMNPTGELTVEEGARTAVELATLAEDGPSGGFFHRGKRLPW